MSHYCYVDGRNYESDTHAVHAVPWISDGPECEYDDPNMTLFVTHREALVTQTVTVNPKYVDKCVSISKDSGDVNIDRMSILSGIHLPLLHHLVHDLGRRVGVVLLRHGSVPEWITRHKDNPRYEAAHVEEPPCVELFGLGDTDEVEAEDLFDMQLFETDIADSEELPSDAESEDSWDGDSDESDSEPEYESDSDVALPGSMGIEVK